MKNVNVNESRFIHFINVQEEPQIQHCLNIMNPDTVCEKRFYSLVFNAETDMKANAAGGHCCPSSGASEYSTTSTYMIHTRTHGRHFSL